jgi:hypothetical protein
MKFLYASFIFTITLTACGQNADMDKSTIYQPITVLSKSELDALAKKNIYFAHQSVGDNIIDGIKDIQNQYSEISLNIRDISNESNLPFLGFSHSSIGKNGDPISKINDFDTKLSNGIGKSSDIAFLKLCFWDIRRNTDIKAVFDSYKQKISKLQKEYPAISFVHFTVPLMTHSGGLLDDFKRFFKTDNQDLDNIKRNELNSLIRNEYSSNALLFDIATLESTLPDGSRTTFTYDGKSYYYLANEYTDDGGHLNPASRRMIATQLVIFLAQHSH